MSGVVCLGWVRRVLLVGVVFVVLPAGSALATTVSFTTKGCSTWSVPSGVWSVQISAVGAAGAPGHLAPGGTGDGVSAILSGLSAPQTLDVCVDFGGGAGGSTTSGFDGGVGGGASGVSLGSDFTTPGLVAGGGGGGGEGIRDGGGAGEPSGSFGVPIPPCLIGSACGGGGGTQSTFGNGGGGAGCFGCGPGGAGAKFSGAGPGTGGVGGSTSGGRGGGGGGGGYYGGGGGGGAGGGDGAGGGGGPISATTPRP